MRANARKQKTWRSEWLHKSECLFFFVPLIYQNALNCKRVENLNVALWIALWHNGSNIRCIGPIGTYVFVVKHWCVALLRGRWKGIRKETDFGVFTKQTMRRRTRCSRRQIAPSALRICDWLPAVPAVSRSWPCCRRRSPGSCLRPDAGCWSPCW